MLCISRRQPLFRRVLLRKILYGVEAARCALVAEVAIIIASTNPATTNRVAPPIFFFVLIIVSSSTPRSQSRRTSGIGTSWLLLTERLDCHSLCRHQTRRSWLRVR